MTKKETIQNLTNLMAFITMAYFKGRLNDRPLRVKECYGDSAAISIDLFYTDGKPVCDGLKPCVIKYKDGREENVEMLSIVYDPDNETPLEFMIGPRVGIIITFGAESLPDDTLKNIAEWLERAVFGQPKRESNVVSSFFYYMWNAWCKEECQVVYGDLWQHFWSKWCHFCKSDGVRGAAECLYAELDKRNRDKLVARAVELYDGMIERKHH